MRIYQTILFLLFFSLSGRAQVVSSIDLTDPIIENNLTFVLETNPSEEAYTIATIISGTQCRHIPQDRYAYFTTTNASIQTSDNNLLISITFNLESREIRQNKSYWLIPEMTYSYRISF